MKSNIDSRYTFKNFVIGASNELACESAFACAKNPSNAHIPLLIYGSTGLGKTHLLHAIGNEILENDPEAIVCYVHSEQFVNDLINALKTAKIAEFKSQYQSVTALLIDDVQFFAGKERTQEEFCHTFNSLLECKQRVIITCDKFPKEVDGLESRLKSRLGWGLSVCIDPPDFKTRVAILQKKSVQQGFNLSDDVANIIAEKIKSNARELEGALNTLWTNASFMHVEISLDFTKKTLKELFNEDEIICNEVNIVFSHGKESGPWGSKITKMADYAKTICECKIHSLDYQDLNSPDERVERLVPKRLLL